MQGQEPEAKSETGNRRGKKWRLGPHVMSICLLHLKAIKYLFPEHLSGCGNWAWKSSWNQCVWWLGRLRQQPVALSFLAGRLPGESTPVFVSLVAWEDKCLWSKVPFRIIGPLGCWKDTHTSKRQQEWELSGCVFLSVLQASAKPCRSF